MDRRILWGLLGLSIVGNVVLGYQSFSKSQITPVDTEMYKECLTALNQATVSFDNAQKESGAQQLEDLAKSKANLEHAGGVLEGFTSKFRRQGIDSGWIIGYLDNTTELNPNDPQYNWQLVLLKNNLHRINSQLKETTYSSRGLTGLRKTINTLNNSLRP